MRTNCPDCKREREGPVIKGYTPCDECRLATLHNSHVDIRTSQWKWPDRTEHCFRCGKHMTSTAVHGVPSIIDGDDELENECTIMFVGGYGSFIDDLGQLPSATICHECGHELCEWLGIDPRNWHTHSVHGGQHADHHDE